MKPQSILNCNVDIDIAEHNMSIDKCHFIMIPKWEQENQQLNIIRIMFWFICFGQ